MQKKSTSLLIILVLLLFIELFSIVDDTIFRFSDTHEQHFKLFFDEEKIGSYFVTNGGVVTNVDVDILRTTYLVSYNGSLP